MCSVHRDPSFTQSIYCMYSLSPQDDILTVLAYHTACYTYDMAFWLVAAVALSMANIQIVPRMVGASTDARLECLQRNLLVVFIVCGYILLPSVIAKAHCHHS